MFNKQTLVLFRSNVVTIIHGVLRSGSIKLVIKKKKINHGFFMLFV